ncbi:MFS transporter [bacterium BMS3Abin03]|nr:MFS transporter [bacterium BMS3Abin03]
MKLKSIPKQVVILGLVSLFTDIASEMLYPVTPIFLTAVLGSSMAVVGIIEGIAEITAGLLKGYAGNLSDKIGKRSIFVIIGYSLSALSKPLPGIFPNISSVIISRTTDRVGKGIRTAPRDALLGSYSEGNSGAIFGFHRGMDTLGAAIGPLAAILLLYLYPDNFQLVFLAAFVPSVIAVSFTFIVKDRTTTGKSKSQLSYAIFWKTSSKQYKILLVLIVIFSFVNSSDVFLILKSKSISGSDILAILGYVFYNLIYAVTSYPFGKLSDKFGKNLIFGIGLLIFSLIYFGFALSTEMIFIWILFAFYGIYSASTEGISKAWISDLVSDEMRGSAIGLVTMLSSFSIMLGSFTAGVLWDSYGSTVPFLLSAVVSLVVGVLILSLKFMK